MTPPDSLALLRLRIARIERKWALGPQASRLLSGQKIEEVLTGEIRENEFGQYFYTVRETPAYLRHGNVEISGIAETAGSPLGIATPAARWAFLDTETTGLAGGTGTYAFLIGIGEASPSGFRVHQFFMRDFAEEPALLKAVADFLEGFDALVTYNGKSYDAPLMETRYRLNRREAPHERLEHLDLLHSARRLWKLRLKSCRLVELEKEILGFEREGDLPGELIPSFYFDYLRHHNALRLVPIFHHNRMDILTLAALTSLVLAALGDPARAPLAYAMDLCSLAAWVARLGKSDSAVELYLRALSRSLPDDVAARARRELAALYKRSRNYAAALPLWEALCAWEELAKYHEHRARDFAAALDAAGRLPADHPGRERRLRRLERRSKAQTCVKLLVGLSYGQ